MVCAQCNQSLGRKLRRCHECGACEECCICAAGPDCGDYNPDTGSFDRDELGKDPEED